MYNPNRKDIYLKKFNEGNKINRVRPYKISK